MRQPFSITKNNNDHLSGLSLICVIILIVMISFIVIFKYYENKDTDTYSRPNDNAKATVVTSQPSVILPNVNNGTVYEETTFLNTEENTDDGKDYRASIPKNVEPVIEKTSDMLIVTVGDTYKIIFGIELNKIISIKEIFTYKTEKEAKAAKTSIPTQNASDFANVIVEDCYLVLTYSDDYILRNYSGLSVEELEQSYKVAK